MRKIDHILGVILVLVTLACVAGAWVMSGWLSWGHSNEFFPENADAVFYIWYLIPLVLGVIYGLFIFLTRSRRKGE